MLNSLFPFAADTYAGQGEAAVSVAVSVTGIQLSTAIGNETVIGNAVVSVTGQSLTTTQNSVVASGATTVLVTGEALSTTIANITDGLTLSNTYQSLTNLGSITGRNQNIVFQTDNNGILLKSSYTDAEIWWEAGGTTVGAYLGIAKINDAYFIRFRSGSGQTNQQGTGGGTAGGSNSRAVVNLSVSDSSVASYFDDERHIITWAIEIPDATYLAGRLRLWIDGNEVITYDPYNDDGNVLRISVNAQWAGADSAGYGQGFSQIAGGDGTFDSGATQYQTFTGTSVGSDVYVFAYENQTISQLPIVVTGSALVAVTGESLTTAIGDESVTGNATVSLTGESLSTTQGSVQIGIGIDVLVTGEQLTTAIGDETVVGSATVVLTGEALSTTIGPYSISADGNTTIVVGPEHELDTAIGTPVVSGSAVVSVTGEDLTLSIGDENVTGDANVTLTGEALSVAQNSVTVTANADVSVTGESLNTAIGDETVTGSALVTLTGIPLSIVQGSVEAQAGADVPVTGEALSTAQGSVTVEAGAVVTLTGIELSVVQGGVGVIAWSPVVPGVTNAWTPVDDSNTNTWTEVDDSATNVWTEVDDREVA
jgi:hypothetical protein